MTPSSIFFIFVILAALIFTAIIGLDSKIESYEVAGSALTYFKEIFQQFGLSHAIFIILLILMFSKYVRNETVRTLQNFQSIRVLGTEIKISQSSASKIETGIEHIFSIYRDQARAKFDQYVTQHDVYRDLERVYGKIRQLTTYYDLNDPQNHGLRLTIHVKDMVFNEYLYQLTEYVPQTSDPRRGRIKSVRYGIIGTAWRTKEHQIEPNVQADEPNNLVRSWGMRLNEAKSVHQKAPSVAALVICDYPGRDEPCAILYFDASAGHAFPNEEKQKQEFIANLVDYVNRIGLTEKLRQLRHETDDTRINIDADPR